MCPTNPSPGSANRSLFTLGDIVETPAAVDVLRQYNHHPIRLLARHLHGDWGDVSADDAAANQEAIANEGRILSCYRMPAGERVWIITECDRSTTTILCPDEY